MKRLYLEIENQNGRCLATIHKGDRTKAFSIPDFNLADEIEINGKPCSLQTLCTALRLYDKPLLDTRLDESGQLAVGRFLYDHTFGRLPAFDTAEFFANDNAFKEIRIITSDPGLISLPWVLLYHSHYLFLSGCAITLSHTLAEGTVEMPALPKLLVIAPDPYNNTQRDAHLAELKDCLAAYSPELIKPAYLQVVSRWDACLQALETHQPHLLYYYGHGEGDLFRVRLLYEGAAPDKADPHALIDLHSRLAGLRGKKINLPLLAYFNCCQGNSGGLSGAGLQLAGLIPAVVTNRTTAWIACARSQALTFWDSLLCRSLPPCRASVEVYSRLGDSGFSACDIRWLTPVLHLTYDRWQASGVDPISFRPDPFLNLDRTDSHKVLGQSLDMLHNYAPRSFAFCWYGPPGQGIRLFHQRLLQDFRGRLPANIDFISLQPAWPPTLNSVPDPAPLFAKMMLDAFPGPAPCRSLEEVKDAIRRFTDGASGRTTLVYLEHHIPYRDRQLFNPVTARRYLDWLDRSLIPLLPQYQFLVTGLSFEATDPEKFRQFADKARLSTLSFTDTHFELLPPLGSVTPQDLISFISIFYSEIPPTLRSTFAAEIIRQTQGAYEPTLDRLKDYLVNRTNRAAPAPDAADDDDIPVDY